MSADCSGESVPVVRLALAKQRCLRSTGVVLSNPSTVAAWIVKHYGCQPQENFLGLFFNARNELLAVQEVTLGTLDTAQVDPRVLFSAALLSGASAMVLAHNHPSGDPTPSHADIIMTRQLALSARLLAIKLLDHIVVGRGGDYASFVEKGLGHELVGT